MARMESTAPTWGEPFAERSTIESLRTLVAGVVEPPCESASPPPLFIADRYRRVSLLGRGGMGEVWHVHDEVLDRAVAMKVLRSELSDERGLQRFREEARIAAGLQHPGIVPVHDIGTLDDGRVWFTMKEVKGPTMEQVLVDVHRAWRMGASVGKLGFTFRRMLEAFLRVCETVAYAHAHGVVHRDLKPSNVMVADYGEVLVLDWGLARVLESNASAEDGPAVSGNARLTRAGAITGTPAYMAPEQARGELDKIGPATDVYALGATLFDLLAERPPRIEKNVLALIDATADGKPHRTPSQVSSGPPVNEALEAICLHALAHEPEHRFPDAGAMARDLAAWLDGALRTERAMALVVSADEAMREADEASAKAAALAKKAKEILDSVASNAPAADKAEGWKIEDEAAEHAEQSRAARVRGVGLLRSALSHEQDLVEAHDRLAEAFLEQHRDLEAAGRQAEARSAETELRRHDRSGHHAAYLAGTGALTVTTEPPGALVRLHRFVERSRRLEPVFEEDLGVTPLVMKPVPMGNYLITLHLEGHEEVRYPVWIRRQEHWEGRTVRLPRAGSLDPGDCYVPGGWTWLGDDRFEATLPLQRVWIEPFVVRRFPITVGEWVIFLNDLLDSGHPDRAEALQPLIDAQEPFFGRGSDGRFTGIRTDMDGWGFDVIPMGPDAPMVFVKAEMAQTYADWRADQDGVPWRLGREAEWIRAARGADQRMYPWGDQFEPSWARTRYTDDRIHFVAVGIFPTDVSVFGVRGLAGNLLDWTLDANDQLVRVGGHCSAGPVAATVTHRAPSSGGFCSANLGFRLFRSFGETVE